MIKMLQSCFALASFGSNLCLISSTFTVSSYRVGVSCSTGICGFEVTNPARWDIRPEVSSMNQQAELCASVLVIYLRCHFAIERYCIAHVGDLFLYNATSRLTWFRLVSI